MKTRLSLERILGPSGADITAAMKAGLRLPGGAGSARIAASRSAGPIRSIPAFRPIDKSALQDSFGGNQAGPSDDFLVGRGLFYLTEQRKLFLDCTSGHYQMLWGYNHPELCAAITAASRAGVIWDNHSNIPQSPLKWLAHRLVEPGQCARRTGPARHRPAGRLHRIRGLRGGAEDPAARVRADAGQENARRSLSCWTATITAPTCCPSSCAACGRAWRRVSRWSTLQPNDPRSLAKTFRKHGSRMAGFWAEPVMMNREAIAVDPDYLQLAQRCCREAGALLCLDEIQTGFWQPEVFEFRALGLQPDLVVLGKGLTAGFHPLSGVLLRHRHDVLEQYDAISTNGSAALPAFVALCSLELIQERARDRFARSAGASRKDSRRWPLSFPSVLQAAHGRGYLAGLKFHQVEDAKRFQRLLLAEGCGPACTRTMKAIARCSRNWDCWPTRPSWISCSPASGSCSRKAHHECRSATQSRFARPDAGAVRNAGAGAARVTRSLAAPGLDPRAAAARRRAV